MNEAHARASDPWTSWAAAKSLDVSRSQAAVMWLFDGGWAIPVGRDDDDVPTHGCMTLEEITEAVALMGRDQGWPRFSDSRIRTAVSELVEKELLVDTGRTRKTRSGRKARLFHKKASSVTPKQGVLL